MRKAMLGSLFVATLLVAGAVLAQTPDQKAGPVWQMYYYHVKPGQAAAALKDFQENGKPFLDEAMKEGFFIDYKLFANPFKERPEDWDILLMLEFPNYAALDQLDTKAAQIGAIYVKQFGSEKAAAEAAKKRADLREVIAIRLVREVPLK